MFVGSPGEDYRDLVQETCARLLAANYKELTISLVGTVCWNVWRDRCARNAVRKTYSLTYENSVAAFVLPQVEEEIECRQRGLELNDWPEHQDLCKHCNEVFNKIGKAVYCSKVCYNEYFRAKKARGEYR